MEFKSIAQDQASHRRSMPTNKGKHKDLVEQRASGRSINGTGGRVIVLSRHTSRLLTFSNRLEVSQESRLQILNPF
jgi:uncharacterized protein YjiK